MWFDYNSCWSTKKTWNVKELKSQRNHHDPFISLRLVSLQTKEMHHRVDLLNNTVHKSISISSPAWRGEKHIDHVRQTWFFQRQRHTHTQLHTAPLRYKCLLCRELRKLCWYKWNSLPLSESRLSTQVFACSAI